jgi:hypothetical protein
MLTDWKQMAPLPIDDWTAALDRMSRALDRMRANLDQHRSDWGQVIDTPADATPPELLLAWLERRLSQWDARLTAATELAAEVERQLDDREATVARWRQVFDGWRGLIEQGLNPTSASSNDTAG